MGSEKFAKMVGILLVSSHSLVVMVSYAISVLTGMSHLYKQCAVGFSAVLFALKVQQSFIKSLPSGFRGNSIALISPVCSC